MHYVYVMIWDEKDAVTTVIESGVWSCLTRFDELFDLMLYQITEDMVFKALGAE